MKKKGQISFVVSSIFFFLIMGFVLWQFTPTLESFADDRIQDTSDSSPLLKLVLYLLVPFLWLCYFVIGAIAVALSTQGVSGL